MVHKGKNWKQKEGADLPKPHARNVQTHDFRSVEKAVEGASRHTSASLITEYKSPVMDQHTFITLGLFGGKNTSPTLPYIHSAPGLQKLASP